MGMSSDTKRIVGSALTLGGLILAVAGLILQQSASLRADIRALDSRLRSVEQEQAQHGLLLQLLAQRVLGMDANLPQPAVSDALPAEAEAGDPA